MKKILLFALCLGVVISCNDYQEPKLANNEILIKEAMNHFSSLPANQSIENRNARLTGDRHSLLKSAVWKSAYFQNLSFGKVLIVPVQFDQELFYKPDANDLKLPLSALTFLLFYKSELKKINMEVITCLPTFDKEHTVQNQAFKGNVLVENWCGELLTGYVFSNGKTYKTLPTSQKSKNGRMVAECTTTDWYTCTSASTYGTNCTYDYSETYCTYSEDGGGFSTGGGSPSSGGSGSSSGGGSSADYNTIAAVTTYIVPGIRGNIIKDLHTYLKCFDQTKPATVTIYVEQPKSGTRQVFSTSRTVGHTFISISQEQGPVTIRRTLGFYPEHDVSSKDVSAIGNDELHAYNISLPVSVNASQLSAVISYINNAPKDYDVQSYNCTNFGIGIAKAAGVTLPSTLGNWGITSRGCTPADLGEDLRTVKGSIPQSGYDSASPNSGTCTGTTTFE